MRRLASESCFYIERSGKWLLIGSLLDEREAESGFGWAMKDNGVEQLCTQERVQQNSVGQWAGKEGWGSCHNEGWKTLKKFHPWSHVLMNKILNGR
ncbi:hypothetical protein TNCV_653381 [Trichonephila clavipes]|nr:hypothetical protein TNCV_653381 [Trichonephila clavipes]